MTWRTRGRRGPRRPPPGREEDGSAGRRARRATPHPSSSSPLPSSPALTEGLSGRSEGHGPAGGALVPGPALLSLAAAADASPAAVGLKARRLALAHRAGLPVPPGFVVTTEAARRLLSGAAEGGGESVLVAIEEALRPLPVLWASGRADAIRRIREVSPGLVRRVEATPWPPALRAEIAAALAGLEGGETFDEAVAARSSAPVEDGADRSWAGHFDTVLDVVGAEALLGAVRRVCASAVTDRALVGRAQVGAASAGLSGASSAAGGGLPGWAMAVLVQRLVPAAWSGILFSEDPKGASSGMVAEVVSGGGAPLAEGLVTPARVVLDRETGEVSRAGGRDRRPLPPAAVFEQLASIARRLEELFGGPQDIEWAVDGGGRVHLLQTRPITATSRLAAARDIWTAANSQEALEDPITPLTYTYLEPRIDAGRRDVARTLAVPPLAGSYMRVIHGRVYFNTGYFRRFLEELPGIPPEIFDRLLFGEGPAGSTIVFPRVRPSWRLAGVGLQILKMWFGAERRFRRYRSRLDRFLARTEAVSLRTLPSRALLARLADLTRYLDEGFRLHVLGSAMAGGTYLLLAKLLQTAGLPSGLGAVEELLRTVPGIQTAEVSEALWDLARAAAERPAVREAVLASGEHAGSASDPQDDTAGAAPLSPAVRALLGGFLARYGHLADKQAELAQPRWREVPRKVLRIVRRYLLAEKRGRRLVPTPEEARRVRLRARIAVDRALRETARPWWRIGYRYLLRYVERYAPYRENMRFHSLRVYERVRAAFLEMGRRLAERGALEAPGDVFFLRFPAVRTAVLEGDGLPPEGARRLKRQAAEAKRLREEALALDPPKLVYEDGSPAPSSARLQRAAAGQPYIEGVGVSGGVVRGPVRLVRSLDAALELEGDAILLAEAAPPAWTPAFLLVRGVVLDIGGMLSHCAVVAREYGIPCVVGARSATALLHDGDVVTLDADQGRVYLPDERRDSGANRRTT